MKQLVEFLATSLVDHKEEIRVLETHADHKTLYALSVHPEDLGKIIGKKGRTVKAIRVLISALASIQGRQVGLQVLEPEKSGDDEDSSDSENMIDSENPGEDPSESSDLSAN